MLQMWDVGLEASYLMWHNQTTAELTTCCLGQPKRSIFPANIIEKTKKEGKDGGTWQLRSSGPGPLGWLQSLWSSTLGWLLWFSSSSLQTSGRPQHRQSSKAQSPHFPAKDFAKTLNFLCPSLAVSCLQKDECGAWLLVRYGTCHLRTEGFMLVTLNGGSDLVSLFLISHLHMGKLLLLLWFGFVNEATRMNYTLSKFILTSTSSRLCPIIWSITWNKGNFQTDSDM